MHRERHKILRFYRFWHLGANGQKIEFIDWCTTSSAIVVCVSHTEQSKWVKTMVAHSYDILVCWHCLLVAKWDSFFLLNNHTILCSLNVVLRVSKASSSPSKVNDSMNYNVNGLRASCSKSHCHVVRCGGRLRIWNNKSKWKREKRSMTFRKKHCHKQNEQAKKPPPSTFYSLL